MNQLWLLLIFGGIAFISWLFGKLKEQAEINRAKQQSRRQYEESLRTGRGEGEPAAATTQPPSGMSQDLRTLAQRRQEQLRALREQQAERMRRATGRSSTTTRAPSPDPSPWTRGQTAQTSQPARRPTPQPPIRSQPTPQAPQRRQQQRSTRQPQLRQPQQPQPRSSQRRTQQPQGKATPPPTRTRHERGQRIIEVERMPRQRRAPRETPGTRSLLVPFSQEAMSAGATDQHKRPARFTHEELRRAVIMFEVFNKPVCLREPDESPGAFPNL